MKVTSPPIVRRAILWMVSRDPAAQNVVDHADRVGMKRRAPFWPDEFTDRSGKHHNRPPWWRPFNILLHRWLAGDRDVEKMHDHPRWSITIVLRGMLVEHTPWGKHILTPGSVVIRSRKFIHSLEVPPGHRGKTWTLFVVGRRNHLQSYFTIEGYDREY